MFLLAVIRTTTNTTHAPNKLIKETEVILLLLTEVSLLRLKRV